MNYEQLANYIGVNYTTIHSLVSRQPGLQAARRYLTAHDGSSAPVVGFDLQAVEEWRKDCKKQMQRITKAKMALLLHRAVELLQECYEQAHGEPLDLIEVGLEDVQRVRPPATPQEPDVGTRTAPLFAAARMLGVSIQTIRRWADRGKLRHTRSIGGHRRVFVEDVIQLKRERARAKEDDLGF